MIHTPEIKNEPIQSSKKSEKRVNNLKDRTSSFALRIIRLYSWLPKEPVAQVIGKQVLRSGTSVGANYREAFRARSEAEFVAKLGDCLKELDETSYWLELLTESGIVNEPKLQPLKLETDELISIFVSVVKRTKANYPKKPNYGL